VRELRSFLTTFLTYLIDVRLLQLRLMKILKDTMEADGQKTLVFVDTKRKADDLTRNMRRDGWPVLCIHGDKQQSERDWVMKGMAD